MSGGTLKAVPQLPALDFKEAKAFYTQSLGAVLSGEYDDLLIFHWEGTELHLWL